jgi:hypothetical protein
LSPSEEDSGCLYKTIARKIYNIKSRSNEIIIYGLLFEMREKLSLVLKCELKIGRGNEACKWCWLRLEIWKLRGARRAWRFVEVFHVGRLTKK